MNPLTKSPKGSCECGCNDFLPEMDIMDTWATSSVTPLINLNWYKEESMELPMSLRPNAHDIIRTWDFYTIVKNLYHTGKLPWNHVMISGHVMASKEEKISKRKENSKMEPKEVISTYSADAVRLWTATGSLGNDIVFSEEEFKNSNKLINKLWNAAKFVVMHLEGFEKKDEFGNLVMLEPFVSVKEKFYKSANDLFLTDLYTMDQYIIKSFHRMQKRYFKYLEKYEIGLALGEIERFFWSFCDDYIEIVKNRLYKPEIYGEDGRESGLFASYYVLLGMLKCFAIYIPHITEEIYQGYFKDIEGCKSIHNSMFLSDNERSNFSNDIIKIGETTLTIIWNLRRYKSENNVSLKTELSLVKITLPDNIDITSTLEDIKSTCTCSNIMIEKGVELSVETSFTNKL